MLWLTGGVSIGFLARTAGRTWAGCCSGRTVRNSESLRGLRCTLQECRGRGKARALLGPLAVRTYRTGVKALSYQSRADERTRAKALSGQSRADERTSAKALSGPKPCGWANENEGFVGAKPCGRADESEGFVGLKPCERADRSEGFVGSKPCGRADGNEGFVVVFVAASHQTRLDTRSKARRPIKVGIKGRGRSGRSRDSNPACQCCSSAHLVQCEPDEASSFTNPNVSPGTYASLRLKLDTWSSAVQRGQKCSSPTRRLPSRS